MTTQKAAPTTLQDVLFRSLRDKRVEPEKRMVGGRYGYAIHRFPIKGGISLGDVLAESITKTNALFRMLAQRIEVEHD
jgi:hypothetical protein